MQAARCFTTKPVNQSLPDTRQSTGWEKIFANDATKKGLISKMHKDLIRLNNNIKKTYPKIGKRPKETFLQKKKYRWPKGTQHP